jgi:hypothetical protein
MGAKFHLSLWNKLPWEAETGRLVSSEERLGLEIKGELCRWLE